MWRKMTTTAHKRRVLVEVALFKDQKECVHSTQSRAIDYHIAFVTLRSRCVKLEQ